MNAEELKAHVLGRDFASDARACIRTNHLGYMPAAPKFAVLEGDGLPEELEFCLVACASGRTALRQRLYAQQGDFGRAMVFDFSQVREQGSYYVSAGGFRSYPIRIGMNALDEVVSAPVEYFAAQRCGPSETGYLSPCHLEDGIRSDNGQHQDVSGGWHDASDLRKWVSATIDGMVGLAKVYELCGDVVRPGGILEELQWGNRYFLHMQEPQGYVMSHCGGDVYAHSDSNHWTDNLPGTGDERVIQVKPAELSCQLRFVAAQAMTARVARSQGQEDYAKTCLQAGLRCLDWSRAHLGASPSAETLGEGITACLELRRATGRETYLELAADWARQALALQAWDEEEARGFFHTSAQEDEPYRCIQGDPLCIALCLLLEQAPQHADAPMWKEGLERWALGYAAAFAARNAYGLLPYGLSAKDLGGGRRAGRYFYRYFMGLHERQDSNDTAWWVGVNANIAAMGIALAKASQILARPELLAIAQRQLDWILGANPFDDCHVDLLGRNHHEPFVQNLFVPPTPRIRGAVLNGLGGTQEDQPALWSGSYHTCEYWTPMVCHTMWLAATLKDFYRRA